MCVVMRAAETHSSNIRDFFVGKIGHRDQLDRVHRQNIRDGGGALLPRLSPSSTGGNYIQSRRNRVSSRLEICSDPLKGMPICVVNSTTEVETKGEGAIFLNFLYVHADCTAVIRVFHESMHGNYPDACKISMHVKSLLQTRMMHGSIIRIISYAFLRRWIVSLERCFQIGPCRCSRRKCVRR